MLHYESLIAVSYVWVFLVINNFMYAYLFHSVLESRMRKNFMDVIGATIFSSVVISIVRVMTLTETVTMPLYNMLVLLCLGLTGFLFYKGKIKQYLLLLAAFYAISAISELIAWLVLNTIQDVPYLSLIYYDTTLMIGVVICNMTGMLLVLLLISIIKVKTEHIHIRYLLIYIVFPIYQIILLIGFYAGAGEYTWLDAGIGALIMIFSMLVDVIVIETVENMAQSIRTEEQMLAIQLQRQTENEYRKMTKHYVAQMQAVKQELSKQMKCAYELLDTSASNADITGVLDTSIEGLKHTKISRYCDNAVVNSVLTVKKEIAERQSIDTKIAVTIPNMLQIEPVDLCSVFSNLFDNAIEACVQLPEFGRNRLISVKAVVQADFLIVKVENTKNRIVKQVGKTFVTNKKDSANHGYGLALIHKIAKKYGGQVDITAEEDHFQVCVALRNY